MAQLGLTHRFYLVFGMLIVFLGGQVSIAPALSQEIEPTCFMTRPSGEVVNLDRICNHTRENFSPSGSIQLDSSQIPAELQNQARDYFLVGDLQNAVRIYTQVLQMQPSDADVYFMRGLIYRDMGDRQNAILDLQQAAQLAREQGLPFRSRAAQYLIESLQSSSS